MRSASPPSSSLIPVDDAWRSALRRPVFGTLLLALAFLLYSAPVKEAPFLFNHAPWLNDPFDTVISFMMFYVPLIAAFCVPRVLLCRRSEPLPATRILDLIRGCRVVVVGVSLTLSAEWFSVAIGDNRAQWNDATWLQIGLLVAMSALDIGLILDLLRVRLPRSTAADDVSWRLDWLADSFVFLKKISRCLGPVRRPVLRIVSWTEHGLLVAVRRHPLWTALCACAVFGAGVGANQGTREDYGVPVTVVASVLLATGMFGLLAASGCYLGLVRSSSPWRGAGRRLIDSLVISSIGVLVPFAFRYHLWWLVGSNNSAAGLSQLLGLLGISGAIIFFAAFLAESLLHLHSGRAHKRSPAPTL